MKGHPDIKTNFTELENRIQKLIHLHERLKKEHQELLSENRKLQLELTDEKGKTKRLEEGYKNLKEVEKASARQNIGQIKKKIHDIIGEIDKNVALINVNTK